MAWGGYKKTPGCRRHRKRDKQKSPPRGRACGAICALFFRRYLCSGAGEAGSVVVGAVPGWPSPCFWPSCFWHPPTKAAETTMAIKSPVTFFIRITSFRLLYKRAHFIDRLPVLTYNCPDRVCSWIGIFIRAHLCDRFTIARRNAATHSAARYRTLIRVRGPARKGPYHSGSCRLQAQPPAASCPRDPTLS